MCKRQLFVNKCRKRTQGLTEYKPNITTTNNLVHCNHNQFITVQNTHNINNYGVLQALINLTSFVKYTRAFTITP